MYSWLLWFFPEDLRHQTNSTSLIYSRLDYRIADWIPRYNYFPRLINTVHHHRNCKFFKITSQVEYSTTWGQKPKFLISSIGSFGFRFDRRGTWSASLGQTSILSGESNRVKICQQRLLFLAHKQLLLQFFMCRPVTRLFHKNLWENKQR